jgi:hypothetical protein
MKSSTLQYVFVLGYILFSISLSSNVYSATTQEVNLGRGDSVSVYGRNITLLSVSYESLLVEIDGKKYIYSKDDLENNDGVEIAVDLIYEANKYRNLSVDLTVTVYYRCGNVNCEIGESSSNCCSDCNCSVSSYICFKNKCLNPKLLKCSSDSECDDYNNCTMDLCGSSYISSSSGTVECSNEEITGCISGDGCCPGSCSYTQDSDCIQVSADSVQVNESSIGVEINISALDSGIEKPCRNDSDCNDDNSSTHDRCDEFGKICYYTYGNESSADKSVSNTITGAVVKDAKWHSEKNSFIKKLLDWLLGWF